MEGALLVLGLVFVAAVTGLGLRAVCLRGYYLPAAGAISILGFAAFVFWSLANAATGGFIPGLGQLVIAVGLTLGPIAGGIIGMVWSRWQVAGAVLAGIYLCGMAFIASGL